MNSEPMNYIALARELAHFFHRDQTRKYNPEIPFIEHPEGVAALIDPTTDDYTAKVATALLHDIIEDTTVTADFLRKQDFPEKIVFAVECLTHKDGETTIDYYHRVLQSPVAIHVKLVDVAYNLAHLHDITDDAVRQRLHSKYSKAFSFFASHIAAKPSLFDEY